MPSPRSPPSRQPAPPRRRFRTQRPSASPTRPETKRAGGALFFTKRPHGGQSTTGGYHGTVPARRTATGHLGRESNGDRRFRVRGVLPPRPAGTRPALQDDGIQPRGE